MKTPIADSALPNRRRLVVALALSSLAMVAGCEAIRTSLVPSPHPIYYSLAYLPAASVPARAATPATAPTLIVSPPQAAAGFDSQRMIYLRKPEQLEYFAFNEWIDTPARMLAPLIVTAIDNSGAFRAAVLTPSPAAGELRLDTQILNLQQEFLGTASQLRFTLRAVLVESATRRVIATQEFTALETAASADPTGGAAAANRAVQSVLEKLAAFCAAAIRELARTGGRTPAPTTP